MLSFSRGRSSARSSGPSGVSIGEAQVTLFDQLGNAVTTVTAANGQFRLTNVAIGSYSLRAEAAPFEAVVQSAHGCLMRSRLRSN